MVPIFKFKNCVILSVNQHLFYILYKGTAKWYQPCLLKQVNFEFLRFSKGVFDFLGKKVRTLIFARFLRNLK